MNAIGRRGMVSLGTLEDAFLAQPSADWSAAAAMLEKEGWISAAEARSLRWIWCFGDLIANTDMYRANASFWFGDDLTVQIRMNRNFRLYRALDWAGAD